MQWHIAYFSAEVQEAILCFSPTMQARYIHLTERMIAFGPDLGMPHTRAMGKGLFELRMKTKDGYGRVFFCILAARQIMRLHAFIKKAAKTPKSELKIARKRLKEAFGNEDA